MVWTLSAISISVKAVKVKLFIARKCNRQTDCETVHQKLAVDKVQMLVFAAKVVNPNITVKFLSFPHKTLFF